MALEKETGIVIESWDFGDADRVFTLAGESKVRQKFLCKGIRKSKRRPVIATEIGSLVEIDFYDQPNKEWKSIKEIHLVNRFETLKKSYLGILFSMYICELTASLLPEGEEVPATFVLLKGTLEHTEREGIDWGILPFFKVRLLTQLGMFPRDFLCVSCGEDVFSKKSAFFSWETREIHCGDCHPIPKNHLFLLRMFHIMNHKRYSLALQDLSDYALFKEGDYLLNRYIRSITEKDLKTYFEFYKNLEIM